MTASEIIAKYSVGCPFLVNPEAPAPTPLDPALLATVFGGKNKIREEWITKEQASRNCERFIVALEYDMDHSPKTTNAKQLREIGIIVPTPAKIPDLQDATVHRWLWDIIYGLATLGIFLTGTDHLDDRALLLHLCTKVLKDKITDIPPTPDMKEFIDLQGVTLEVDRDRLLPRPDRRVFIDSPANN
jgi:hypothetical protein